MSLTWTRRNKARRSYEERSARCLGTASPGQDLLAEARRPSSFLLDRNSHSSKALASCMRVSRQHRLDSLSSTVGEIGVIDAGSAQVRDVAMAALVGADI